MTDTAKIENIARKYCELLGLDPDAMTGRRATVIMYHNGRSEMKPAEIVPKWMDFEKEASAAFHKAAMSAAIKEVMKDE